jgi:hypothetical protein
MTISLLLIFLQKLDMNVGSVEKLKKLDCIDITK